MEYASRRALGRHGLTEQDYALMFEQQGGVCAICSRPPVGQALSVDHCHETDQVRGLLCQQCNTGIGMLRDDPQLLLRAVSYLEQLQNVGVRVLQR